MSREDFSEATKRKIHTNYNNRCAVCLKKEPVVGERGWDCTHVIAAAGLGKARVCNIEANLHPANAEEESLACIWHPLRCSTPGI